MRSIPGILTITSTSTSTFVSIGHSDAHQKNDERYAVTRMETHQTRGSIALSISEERPEYMKQKPSGTPILFRNVDYTEVLELSHACPVKDVQPSSSSSPLAKERSNNRNVAKSTNSGCAGVHQIMEWRPTPSMAQEAKISIGAPTSAASLKRDRIFSLPFNS